MAKNYKPVLDLTEDDEKDDVISIDSTVSLNSDVSDEEKPPSKKRALISELSSIVNSKHNWFSVSVALPATVITEIMSSDYYQKKRNHNMDDVINKKESTELEIKYELKKIILDSILMHIEPLPFIPCFITDEPGSFNFYIYGCTGAMKKLGETDFKCPSKLIKSLLLQIKISPSSPHQRNFSITQFLKNVLKMRSNKETKTLDLSNFESNKCFQENVYFPLWYPANQKILTALLIYLNWDIRHLDLSHNSIENFASFDLNAFSNLHTLNASHNKISAIHLLAPFHGILVRDLKLEFNPMFRISIDKQEYVDCIKEIFPTIEFLDGNDVRAGSKPKSIQNYTCDKDSIPIVGRFLEVYFTLFDSEERSLMMNLYTKDSVFTMSCLNKNKNIFAKKTRNILTTFSTRIESNIFIGQRSITGCLTWFPQTEHDPMTFCVDVLQYLENHIVLCVTGLFKVPKSIQYTEPIFEFMHSFILTNGDDYDYKITNEMLQVNPDPLPNPKAFRLAVKNSDKVSLTPIGKLDQETKNTMIDMLVEMTKLRRDIAENCLALANWNYQLALKKAVEQLNKYLNGS